MSAAVSGAQLPTTRDLKGPTIMAGIGDPSAYEYTAISSSQLIKAGSGRLIGVLVSSSSSGTVKIWDSLTATGNVIVATTDTITAPVFLAVPARFNTGCYVTIGGTAAITVFWM